MGWGPRRCEVCGSPLLPQSPSHARFCSTRCRVQPHRADWIPAELRSLPRWVRHVGKRPVRTDGRPASSTEPSTWTAYERAKTSSVGQGLGFVLDGDGIVGIELDHCINHGHLTPAALGILERLPDTYAELSPSHQGVGVFCRAHVPEGRRLTIDGTAVEVCGTGRFLTVTGHRLEDRPSTLADLTDAVAALMA